MRLVCPNPDLLFPKGEGSYGLTAGTVALVLEESLATRYARSGAFRFERLGKPHRPIFDEAARRAGTRSLVMLGDQLHTDIAGANDFGIDSALVLTGVSRDVAGVDRALRPTWILPSLAT